MALSVFDEKAHFPEAEELARVLGPSARRWQELVETVARDHAPIDEVWNFAGAKYGWSLRLKQKDRILVYLTPQAGQFLVGIVLGEKAVRAAHESGLPNALLELLDAAKPYAEGRGIRLPVTTSDGVGTVLRLLELKVGC